MDEATTLLDMTEATLLSRPECVRCGECCRGAPCDLAEHMVREHGAELCVDVTWTEASGETCPLLAGPNGDGEYECLAFDEIMAIPGIDGPDMAFGPGCCND